MDRSEFSAPALGGVLSGWVAGDGAPVLVLHGGPGLSFTYADDMAAELVGECLDEQSMTGGSTEADALEGLRLVWPAYFADPANAPPMPPLRLSVPANALFEDIVAALPGLEQALPGWSARSECPAAGVRPFRAPDTLSGSRVPGAWRRR